MNQFKILCMLFYSAIALTFQGTGQSLITRDLNTPIRLNEYDEITYIESEKVYDPRKPNEGRPPGIYLEQETVPNIFGGEFTIKKYSVVTDPTPAHKTWLDSLFNALEKLSTPASDQYDIFKYTNGGRGG